MRYVLDTNILLHAMRNETFRKNLIHNYRLFQSPNQTILSAVSVGEIYSLALRNRWGEVRLNQLLRFLQKFTTVPVTDDPTFIEIYAEIDVFSQSHHPTLPLTTTARKMGKNDLWIATTAALFNATLITTDQDFTHLKDVFIDLETLTV
ncbi:MAG: tRNA(fMet)-specific endonuclease VapC [Bacteroidota bacterium]